MFSTGVGENYNVRILVRSLTRLFVIPWNVLPLLFIPKGMTRYS